MVAPIGAIGAADGTRLDLPDVGKLSARLRDALLDIQEGRKSDSFGWVVGASDDAELANYLAAG
jgi:hypothetical protein